MPGIVRRADDRNDRRHGGGLARYRSRERKSGGGDCSAGAGGGIVDRSLRQRGIVLQAEPAPSPSPPAFSMALSAVAEATSADG